MKSKLIAGIVTLTVLGGTVTPTFAAVKEGSHAKTKCNINKVDNSLETNGCISSGSLLQGLTFKKLWWSNGSCGGIIIGGSLDKPNNGSGSNDNNDSVVPPTSDTETPNIPNETPDDNVIPPTVDEVPSVPDTPTVDETPSAPDTPTVDETPSVPNTPEVTPPVVDETPSTPSEDNTTNTDTNFMSQVETAIFNKVNEERAKAGVPALTYNNTMQKYARIKSQDMGDNNYFSHEDLNGNLITTKMKNDGVSYRAWGENIAYIGGVSNADALAEQFMTNWMNSQGHRANILSTNFSSIGVGVYKIGNKVYATQEFYK